MTIEAKIIADSWSPEGIRLTTFQLRYPRFIHAELMTHRVFSRNASSSRAIPVKKVIEDLRRDPAMPVFWGSNKPGMQAGAELIGAELAQAQTEWLISRDHAIKSAEFMIAAGLHKQIANRILEPWAHINVVVTATEWNNWYTLRRDEHAQPEIKALADAMWDAHENGPAPQHLEPGDWHLPYVTLKDRLQIENIMIAIKVSVARCARVSYLTHDGRETTIEEDLKLFDRLLGAQPLHASPAEHQATPDNSSQIVAVWNSERGMLEHGGYEWNSPHQHGNFTGWIQFRKTIPGEYIKG